MGEAVAKINSGSTPEKKTKRVADGREAIVRVPPVAPPIEVEVALVGVPVEVRNVAIAVPVVPHGTNVQNIFRATAL